MQRDGLPLVPNEISRSSMSPRERVLRSRAARILNGSGLLHGSLVARERSCGREGCRCERGEKHPALYVNRRQDGNAFHRLDPEAALRRRFSLRHVARLVAAEIYAAVTHADSGCRCRSVTAQPPWR